MPRLTCTILSAIAALTAAGCQKAPEEPAPDQSTAPAQANAANTYRAVYSALGQPLLDAVKSGQNADALLEQHAADIDRLVEATRADKCDFGTDWSQGLSAQLPHLSEARALARILRADAARQLAAGNADAAAQRTAAILRLAAHIAQPGQSSIELIVAIAIAQVGAEFAATNPALAHAEWRTDIQQAIVAVRRGGTLNSKAVLPNEGRMIVQSLRNGTIPDAGAAGGTNWAAATKEARESAAKKLEALYAEAESAWNSGDAVNRLKSLNDRAAKDGVGDLWLPWDKQYEAVNKLNAAIAKANAALKS